MRKRDSLYVYSPSTCDRESEWVSGLAVLDGEENQQKEVRKKKRECMNVDVTDWDFTM